MTSNLNHSILSIRPKPTTSTMPQSIAQPSVYHRRDEDGDEDDGQDAARNQRSIFPFLSLPSELRDKIYGLVFSSVPPVIDLEPFIFNLFHRQQLLSLSFVSKQVHAESSHKFFSTHTFRLFPTHPNGFKTRKPLLARLPAHYRNSISSLQLRVGQGWTDPPDAWVVNAALGLSDCRSVRVLKIFVDVDPSHPMYKGFRKEDGFYERFCQRLLDDILKEVQSINIIEVDSYPGIQRTGDMVSGLVDVVESHRKVLAWGPEIMRSSRK